MAQQPLVGQGPLITEASRWHSHTLHSIVILWTSYKPGTELTTQNIHKRQTSMPPEWFEPTIPVSERPQTHALDRAATWNGSLRNMDSYL
jgi:hypothetical protein